MSKSGFKLMDMTWSLKKDDEGNTNIHIEIDDAEYDLTYVEAKKLHENLGSLLEKCSDCVTCSYNDTMCEPDRGTRVCAHHKFGDK